MNVSSTDVIFTPTVPPDSPQAHRRGFRPGRSVLQAGSTHAPGGQALSSDIILDRDTAITLADGTVVYADGFRPAAAEPVPAILAWSPPWEGFTDVYRYFCARGGIPDLSFARDLMAGNFGRHNIENLAEMIQAHR
jgi:hypothetical protein